MSTLFRRTLILLLPLPLAWANPTEFIDDSDSRILYSGTWTKNPISDPENFNYDGTLTYTNDATAKATFTFTNAIQVMVFGSFPVAGTFPMHSTYTIDGAGLTQYEPPSVISKPVYREHFFTSNNLSTSTHTLVIANLGKAFYLDGIVLTLPATSSLSPSSTPTQNSAPSAPSTNTSPVSSPNQPATSTTIFVVTQGETTSTPQITQTLQNVTSSSSSSTGIGLFSFSPVSIVPSIDASSSTSSLANATSVPTQVSSTGTSHTSGAVALPVGVYVAIGVGGFTAVALVVAGVYFLCRRRRHRAIQSDVDPFDPGLTSLSSEKSLLSARPHAHVNRASSTASTLYHSAPPYTPVDETRSAESISHASEGDVLHVVPEDRGAHIGAAYEPLGSPSVMSPLVPVRFNGHDRDTLSPLTSSPISPASNMKRVRRDTHELRRRSVDGGVRLAGGPSGTRRDASLADVDARSAVSTLPPVYDSYPAA